MLHIKALIAKDGIKADEGEVEVVGSTGVIDRMGDTIDQSGWQLKNFKLNPVILWGHNMREERPPIGKALKVWIQDKGKKTAKLMFKVKFDLKDSFAVEIFRKIQDGFINTVSVGFNPMEWEDKEPDSFWSPRHYTKHELLELSWVPVPANPEAHLALKSLKDKRFDPVKLEEIYPDQKKKKKTKKKVVKKVKKKVKSKTKVDKVKTTVNVKVEKKEIKKIVKKAVKKIVKKVIESKKVIAFKDLDTMPDSEAWDGPGELAKAEVADLKKICTWFDDEKADKKSSYKLPHHKAEGHKCVWRGVAASMAKLLGAKGGLDIPKEDRKAVYNHLRSHYNQFDKDVPSFTAVEDQALKGFDEEIHAITLDREDRYMIRLIKKVIKGQKKIKKKKTVKGYTPKQIESALQVLDSALSQLPIDSVKGGGKKG